MAKMEDEWFESCVVSDGNQTTFRITEPGIPFESCVVSDGNQTICDTLNAQG